MKNPLYAFAVPGAGGLTYLAVRTMMSDVSTIPAPTQTLTAWVAAALASTAVFRLVYGRWPHQRP